MVGRGEAGEAAAKTRVASPQTFAPQEQPLKSISAAVVVAPGVTLSGFAGVLESLLVVCDGIEHIGAPEVGFVASASTV